MTTDQLIAIVPAAITVLGIAVMWGKNSNTVDRLNAIAGRFETFMSTHVLEDLRFQGEAEKRLALLEQQATGTARDHERIGILKARMDAGGIAESHERW